MPSNVPALDGDGRDGFGAAVILKSNPDCYQDIDLGHGGR